MKTLFAISLSVLVSLSVAADYLNPCGIIQGGDAWFKIGLQPADFPDAEIEWHQSGNGSVSFPDGNRGRVVRVQGVDCGDVTLEVQIGDARSPRPCFHAKVVTNAVIGVSVWVISDGATPASSEDRARAMLSKANEIWKQAGISFRLDDYCVTNRPDMLNVGYSSTNGVQTVNDVAALNPATGRIMVYFVRSIGGRPDVHGATLRSGILVSERGTTTTLAHEIGHALGLLDIYILHPLEPTGMRVSGLVSRAMTPDDWNGGTGQRYYASGTTIESLIPRLLMYGGGGDGRADITIGDIYGLCYSNRWNGVAGRWTRDWRIGQAPVGFFRHGFEMLRGGLDEQIEGGNAMTIRETATGLALAAAIVGNAGELRSTCGDEGHPPLDPRCFAISETACQEPISDSEAVEALESVVLYEHNTGVDAKIFWRMGEDRERMTKVLIRSAEDARSRKYKDWKLVAQCSIESMSAYGTKTAVPFLESVLTNDVFGAGLQAATAYVRLAGDDRDFEFFKANFGDGKRVPRDVGGVIYQTLGERLKDKSPQDAKRKEYVDYLMSRAECENDIVTGSMLDKILVEHVPGYRDSEERKRNLQILQKPTLKPFRMIRTADGLKVVEGDIGDGERVRMFEKEK